MLRPNISITDKDFGFKKFRKELDELNGGFVLVGFPNSAEPGQPKQVGSGGKPYENMSEVNRVATWNEFGVPGPCKNGKQWKNPPRPFFRSAIDGNREALKNFKEKVYGLFLLRRLSPAMALDEVGLWMQAKIRQSILKGGWTPNAPSTKKRKGSSKPLVDTGQMVNSVTFVNSLDKK
jgi:hypothetical protein